MIYNYFLGLGSNIEPRLYHLHTALEKLTQCGQVRKKSGLYLTQAWGEKEQNDFYNAVVEFNSDLPPRYLLDTLKRIEQEAGRKSSSHWGPRQIDIDILYCSEASMEEKDLQIPHQYVTERRFVLEPLAELVENLTIHGRKIRVRKMLQSCQDPSQVSRLDLAW